MKTFVSILLLFFAIQSSDDLIGKWVWCKDVYVKDNLTASRNHCMQITFNTNGTGKIDESNFLWKKNGNKIDLAFNSKNPYFSERENVTLTIANYKGNEKADFALIDSLKMRYILLIKEK